MMVSDDRPSFWPILCASVLTALVIAAAAIIWTDLPPRGVLACLYAVIVLSNSVLWRELCHPCRWRRSLLGACSFALMPLCFGSVAPALLLAAALAGIVWFNIPPRIWHFFP